MNITIKQVEGITFIGKGDSNHWISIDGPKNFNGSEAGSRPMELVLIALGSCSGSDIVSILKKKKVSYESFEINIAADRQDTHPKIFTKIHLDYIFFGKNIPEKDVERSIDLSQNKYCPVNAMLSESCKITYSYQIKEKKN